MSKPFICVNDNKCFKINSILCDEDKCRVYQDNGLLVFLGSGGQFTTWNTYDKDTEEYKNVRQFISNQINFNKNNTNSQELK